MSTVINQGSQVVLFDFKQDATSSTFNQLFDEILDPGVYNEAKFTIKGNFVELLPFDVVIKSDSERANHIRTREIVLFQPEEGWLAAVPGQTLETVIYLLYDWADTVENWMSFNAAVLPIVLPENAVVLGTVLVDENGNLVPASENLNPRAFGFNKQFMFQSLISGAPVNWSESHVIGGGSEVEPDEIIFDAQDSPLRIRLQLTWGAPATPTENQIEEIIYSISLDNGTSYVRYATETRNFNNDVYIVVGLIKEINI